MLGFIAAMMDVGGKVPMIGDSDDAVMVRFSRESGLNVYRSLLATGAVLFERADFARKAGVFDDKSRWLLGDNAQSRFDALHGTASPSQGAGRAFPDSGYYLLGCDLGEPAEIRLVADAGPLIAFGRIGKVNLLPEVLGQVLVPNSVVAECLADLEKPGALAIREALRAQLLIKSPERHLHRG